MYKRSERNHNRKDIAQYFEMLYFYMYKKGQTKLKVITKENKKMCLKNRRVSFVYKELFKRNFYKSTRKISKTLTYR